MEKAITFFNAFKKKIRSFCLFIAIVGGSVLFLRVITKFNIVSLLSALMIMISFFIQIVFESDYTARMLIDTKKAYDGKYTSEVTSQIAKCETIICHKGRREIKRFRYIYEYCYQGKKYKTKSDFHSWKPSEPGTQRIIYIDCDYPENVYDKDLITDEIRASRIESCNNIIWVISFIVFIFSTL